MKATMLAHDAIIAGSADIVVAGGMESMSNAPYPSAQGTRWHAHGPRDGLDHMFLDGLEDAYDKGKLMGVFAEQCADKFSFTREAQDEFALRSLVARPRRDRRRVVQRGRSRRSRSLGARATS